MSKYFEYLNLFSLTPSLMVDGKSRPFSIFGCIIGFFTLSILIFQITYIIVEYFSRLNYTHNFYIDNLSKPEINLKNFKSGFVLVNPMGLELQDRNRLFQISAIFWDFYNPKYGDDRKIKIKTVNVPMIKCNQYKKDSLFYDDFKMLSEQYNHIECLDIEKINGTVHGSYGDIGK
jgi:hypothetical protein